MHISQLVLLSLLATPHQGDPNTYVNHTQGFRIERPDAGWNFRVASGSGAPTFHLTIQSSCSPLALSRTATTSPTPLKVSS